MKKIIATVLAMVMALALCTVAFAATTYTAYDADGKKLCEDVTYEFIDGKTVKKGTNVSTVDVYHTHSATIGGLEDEYFVKADKSDYTYKLTADGKADLYLLRINQTSAGKYYASATKYTNIGDGCGQLDAPKSGTYYEATYTDTNGDKQVEYYKASETYGMYLLVDGKLVTVSTAALTKEGHSWKAATYDADDNVTTYKCKDCGTVATVYKTKDAAAASGAAVYSDTEITGKWLAWTDGSTVTPGTKDDNKGTSPKTFDAGIAMYVGMALTSVAGSAVVIGKKKEF